MTLTLAEVEHIADLARLKLTQGEKETYRLQLSAILDYVAQLQELVTIDIPPTSSVLHLQSVLRDDLVAESLTTEALMKNAPDQKKNQFRVPPVFE